MLQLVCDIKQKDMCGAYISGDLHCILRSNYAVGSYLLSHNLVTIYHFRILNEVSFPLYIFASPPFLLLYNMYVSCHRHFFPVLLLNQR